MSLSCNATCVKYLVFAFNLFSSIISFVLIILGGVALANFNEIKQLFPQISTIILPGFVIIIGVIILTISIFGCWGTIQEYKGWINTYTIILLVIIIIQFGISIMGFSGQERIDKETESFFEKAWGHKNEQADKKIIENIQNILHCCGLNKVSDWNEIPSSCCEKYVKECTVDNAYSKGCLTGIHEQIGEKLYKISMTTLIFAFCEFVGVVLACYLSHLLNNTYERI